MIDCCWFGGSGLDRAEQVVELGSRNFFLCATTMGGGSDGGGTMPSSSCATEADKAVTRSGFNWLKFMDFML